VEITAKYINKFIFDLLVDKVFDSGILSRISLPVFQELAKLLLIYFFNNKGNSKYKPWPDFLESTENYLRRRGFCKECYMASQCKRKQEFKSTSV
jgi:hypothetical protein